VQTNAAVAYEPKQSLEYRLVTLADPRPDEVLVRIAASGICGSDLHLIDGTLEIPGPNGPRMLPFPVVPGHEAAGVVEAIGSEVRAVSPGDHVIINIYPGCGHCATCRGGRASRCPNVSQGYMPDGTTRLSSQGQPVHHMAYCSSFAQYAVVTEGGCIKIRPDMPLERACLIGCGVATGYGAVFKAAQVQPGSSVLVLGAGGVGLNVIQSAVLAGATTIVAVDITDDKLAGATAFGATHAFNAAGSLDWQAALRELTQGRGVDFGFEAVSTPVTIRQAFDATANNGVFTIVGLAPPGSEVSYPASITKTVMRGGIANTNPWRDFPAIVELYLAGRFKLDELVAHERPLADVNQALDALRHDSDRRTVLTMNRD
jgi:S-(hydroxymethyl)glutathione dehydrogenase / alcohol dehydrogenase